MAGKYKSIIPVEMLDLAESYLLCAAQSKIQVKDIQSLLPETVIIKGMNDTELPLILVPPRGR